MSRNRPSAEEVASSKRRETCPYTEREFADGEGRECLKVPPGSAGGLTEFDSSGSMLFLRRRRLRLRSPAGPYEIAPPQGEVGDDWLGPVERLAG